MRRITLIIVLGVFCQSIVAGVPSVEAPREQAVESASDQAVEVEAEPTSPPRAEAAEATEDRAIEPTVIVERTYDMRAPIGVGIGVMGSLGIRAIETEDAVQITVDLIVYFDGKAIRMESVVNYDLSSAEPLSGRAQTSVDDVVCMTGTIEFDEATYSYSGVGLMEGDSGAAIDPPLEFGEAELPKPDGAIMFRSDLAVMAPRLLTEDDTIMAVTIVEFPDDVDAPELVTFKSGWYLTRDAADEDGNVTFWLFDQDPTEMTNKEAEKERMPRVTYNASGEIVDYQLNDSFKIVETTESESTEEPQPEEGDDE